MKNSAISTFVRGRGVPKVENESLLVRNKSLAVVTFS